LISFLATPVVFYLPIFVPPFPAFTFKDRPQSSSVNLTNLHDLLSAYASATRYFSESDCLRRTYFPLFASGTLYFDSILILSSHALVFQLFNREHCLQISRQRMLRVAWNRFTTVL